MLASDFHYDLPDEAIAQTAVEPRDASRLLLTSTGEDHRFGDLPTLLRPGDLLVVNRTRVRAARVRGVKETGGAIEALLVRRLDPRRWEALLRPARRIRPGTRIRFDGADGEVLAGPERGVVTLAVDADDDTETWLERAGEIPLPPYFHGELDDPERYQTIFARAVGSAAAPTAALHFTDDLVNRLGTVGVELTEVELEVGLDTFRPMEDGPISRHRMHTERYLVPSDAAAAVASARLRRGRVIAVGTTVLRTLETAAAGEGLVAAGTGHSDLFITPGYRRRVADALLTNFHAPGTTLVVLIAALLGPRWRSLYATALERGFRFLSFGDAMLIDDPTGGPVAM
jgi:S-adenosylmethionine:tRNA ribosyltransferase-isomerase